MAIIAVRDGDEDADDKAADQDYGCDRADAGWWWPPVQTSIELNKRRHITRTLITPIPMIVGIILRDWGAPASEGSQGDCDVAVASLFNRCFCD